MITICRAPLFVFSITFFSLEMVQIFFLNKTRLCVSYLKVSAQLIEVKEARARVLAIVEFKNSDVTRVKVKTGRSSP